MLHFEGDKEFPQAPAALWEKLSDARFLVGCIPDVTSVAQAEREQAVCKIRPGFAFVRGTLELTLRVAEAVPPSAVRLQLQTKGIGTSSQVEAAVALAGRGEGSRLHWDADVKELGGLLKAVPQGLLKAAAQKVIGDAWNAVEAKLREPPLSGEPPA